ncbi:MAG: hypothetical protein MUF14_09875 [Hyphomonadaceae bacterium]|nr:hypothetical protein [Hyphomonadaceae bacterium]
MPKVKDVIADHSRDWLTLLFAGLGVSFAPHEWIGGMFLALAGASYARHMEPEQDRRELWAVMVAAFLASHVAGMASHAWFPDVPVQLSMLAAGFASRRATRIAMRIMGLIEVRSDAIADKVIDRVLPGGPPKQPTEGE